MNNRLTTEEFIRRARKVHGDKFDYEDVQYTTQYVEVRIICPIHGAFHQKPTIHIKSKHGCPHCARENRPKYKRKKKILVDEKKLNVFHNILDITSEVTSISPQAILTTCKRRDISDAKRIMCYVLRKKYKYSLKTISSLMGFGAHTSVFFHCRNHENLIYDKNYQSKYNQIIKELEL